MAPPLGAYLKEARYLAHTPPPQGATKELRARAAQWVMRAQIQLQAANKTGFPEHM